jgi:hypothetical protein
MGGSTFYRENFDAGDQTTDVAAALTTQVMTAVADRPRGRRQGHEPVVPVGRHGRRHADQLVVRALRHRRHARAARPEADQLTAAWAADTIKTLALATAYTATATGVYYAAIMVKATTVPSLICKVAGRAAANSALLTGYKVKGLTSGRGPDDHGAGDARGPDHGRQPPVGRRLVTPRTR